jgi:hypothetical protein
LPTNAQRISKEYEKSQLSKQQQLKSRNSKGSFQQDIAGTLAMGLAEDASSQPNPMRRRKASISQNQMPVKYASVI